MAHHAAKDGYRHFADRLNLFPQGAPPTELLFKTLRALISEDEATWLSLLPIRPFKAERAAAAWHVALSEARSRLDELCGKCILLDMTPEDGDTLYMLPAQSLTHGRRLRCADGHLHDFWRYGGRPDPP